MSRQNTAAVSFLFLSMNLGTGVGLAAEPRSTAATALVSADSIIYRLEQATRDRDYALQSYTASRTYRAVGQRANTEAEMQAVVKFERPSSKQFTVVSEEGSGVIRRSVFRGMMEAEADAMRPERRRRSALTSENYRFTLAGREGINGNPCYVLDVEPLREDKYLFRGRVWVDASEFAVARVQGRPAKMPSFWTRKITFVRDYRKIGDFWMPVKDESVTQVRLFGEKTVTIEHSDYRLEAQQLQASNR